MDSGNREVTIIKEEEWHLGMELVSFLCLPMAMKAAVELDVLEIIAKAGHGVHISPKQIVAQIPGISNPDAAVTLDRILRVLASHSVLSSFVSTGEDGKPERLYGLTHMCKYLVKNNEGISLAPGVLANGQKFMVESWNYLKDAVLEGCQPFVKANGMDVYEYMEQKSNVFNRSMAEGNTIVMRKILDAYQGFKDVDELVDVGGGVGYTLSLIVSKYPHIKGVNFDLPHVVKVAPEYPGVTHVGGDMFESVPSGKVIFLKSVLLEWTDEHCLKILKNCHKALPEGGKVIVMDYILPVAAETSSHARHGFHLDLMLLAYAPYGKERTEQDFRDLAKAAGFAGGVKPICCVNGTWLIELYKTSQ